MDETTIPYTVLNEDISDDKEPILYIQRYVYPKRVYQVFRKEWDEEAEGEFEPNPAYAEKYWGVSTFLFETFDDDDELLEVFAVVYRDEENPPFDDPEKIPSDGDPCFNVVYDPDDELYKCEPTGIYGDDVVTTNKEYEAALERVAELTLRAAIDRSVALLDHLIENSIG